MADGLSKGEQGVDYYAAQQDEARRNAAWAMQLIKLLGGAVPVLAGVMTGAYVSYLWYDSDPHLVLVSQFLILASVLGFYWAKARYFSQSWKELDAEGNMLRRSIEGDKPAFW